MNFDETAAGSLKGSAVILDFLPPLQPAAAERKRKRRRKGGGGASEEPIKMLATYIGGPLIRRHVNQS